MRHPDSAGGHRLHSRPVFVDRSGARRRRVVVIGAAIATALITGLVVLIVGFVGTPTGHVPGFPGADGVPQSAAPSATAAAEPSVTTQRPATAQMPSATPAPGSLTPSPTPRRHYPSHPPKPSKSR